LFVSAGGDVDITCVTTPLLFDVAVVISLGGGNVDVACVTMPPLFDVVVIVSTGGRDVDMACVTMPPLFDVDVAAAPLLLTLVLLLLFGVSLKGGVAVRFTVKD